MCAARYGWSSEDFIGRQVLCGVLWVRHKDVPHFHLELFNNPRLVRRIVRAH